MRALNLVRSPLWATLLAALVAAVSLLVFAQSGGAIAGGTYVNDGKYPFMVSLHDIPVAVQQAPLTRKDTHFCGGTLVTPNHVLTAAHCFDQRNETSTDPSGQKRYRFEVVIGRTVLSNETQGEVKPIFVGDRYIHPRWRNPFSKLGEYDVAILKLRTISSQAPIRLASPTQDYLETPGRPAFIAGWGAYNSAGTKPDRLVQVRVPILSDDYAMNLYSSYAPDNEVAAGAAGRRACQGDSGGPLFGLDGDQPPANTNYQIGILSYGYALTPQCGAGTTQVFTEVNAPRIKEFIDACITRGPSSVCPAK